MIIQEITRNKDYNQNILAVKFNLSPNEFQQTSSEELILHTILNDAIYENFRDLSTHIGYQVVQFISSYMHTLNRFSTYQVRLKINDNQSQVIFSLTEFSKNSI